MADRKLFRDRNLYWVTRTTWDGEEESIRISAQTAMDAKHWGAYCFECPLAEVTVKLIK